jgi:ABC-type amino acid transport system permease subunit
MDGAIAGALPHIRKRPGDQVTDAGERQRKIRRNAILLGLLALAFYVGFYVAQIARSAG